MNSLISKAFSAAKKENRPALLTYTVAGDNTKKKSLEILKSISNYADICELGFPHNTPIADGGQIQTSAYRAIKNGIKINDVFSIVKNFKKIKKNKPIILMGYYNMIYQYNENKFLEKCKKSKVDGLIVVDLPYPENKNFASKCKKKGINFIQLVSPTTSKIRLKKIIKDSHDMIYYISMLSTTGGKLKVSPKKILEKYNKSITYWESESDRGQAHAINKGFNKATGDIITFCNSDDIYLPGTFNYIAEKWGKWKSYGAFVGSFRYFDEKSTFISEPIQPKMMTQGPIDLTIGPMGNYRLHQVSTFYTKIALDIVGRYVADYYNYVFDRELLYRIINRFSVYLDNRALGAFRIHQNSKSNSKIIPFSIEFARLYRNKKDGNVKHDKMREERAKIK